MAEKTRFAHLRHRRDAAASLRCARLAALTLLVGSSLLASGCQFDQSIPPPPATPDDGGMTDGGLTDGGLTDGGVTDGGVTDAMPVLSDNGLVARYFIDEATSGMFPTQLSDSQLTPTPLPLFVSFNDGLAYTEIDGNAGLAWPTAKGTGRAAVSNIDGTKIATSLQGASSATIELVARVDDTAMDGPSRLLHIGQVTELGFLSLTATSPGELRMFMRGNDPEPVGTWSITDVMMQRIVIHAVFDSTQFNESERVRLYVNGTRVPSTGGTAPAQSDTINLGTGSVFYLGNRGGIWSIDGVIFYAAVYSQALTDQDIAGSTARLMANDDSAP